MKSCICVSGIKYQIRTEAELELPEFEEYSCPESCAGGCSHAAGGDVRTENGPDAMNGADACVNAVAGGGACVDITVTEEDIAAEQKGDLSGALSRNLFKAAVLRRVAVESIKRNRLLVHGACIAFEGKGYLFSAPSGTGKTTHIRLWKEYLGDAVSIVNGDKPILEIREASVLAYGTPWAGKEGYQTNTSVPLGAVVEIVRSGRNRIRQVDRAQAFMYLFQHSFLGEKDAEQTRARMNAVKKIVSCVPMYVLECDMSEEAFVCSFEMLTGKRAAECRGAETGKILPCGGDGALK